MAAFAVAHLNNVRLGPEIVRYLERIDSTLEPFQGRFVVHGKQPRGARGVMDSTGPVIVVEGVPAGYRALTSSGDEVGQQADRDQAVLRK